MVFSESQPTFRYVESNLTEALDMFLENTRNVGLGGLLSAIAELLGRIIRNPQSNNGRANFKEFALKYLKPLDDRYYQYADLLYSDLRNGAAHSVLPKGGVSLSYHAPSSSLHLEMINRNGEGFYHLWLYSPKLIMHWKRAMLRFVADARKNQKLAERYEATLLSLRQDSQRHIKQWVSSKVLQTAKIRRVQGDIKF